MSDIVPYHFTHYIATYQRECDNVVSKKKDSSYNNTSVHGDKKITSKKKESKKNGIRKKEIEKKSSEKKGIEKKTSEKKSSEKKESSKDDQRYIFREYDNDINMNSQWTVVTYAKWGGIEILINNITTKVRRALTRYVQRVDTMYSSNVRRLQLYKQDLIIGQTDIIPYNWKIFDLHHDPGYTVDIVKKIQTMYKGNLILTTGWDSKILSYGNTDNVLYMSTPDGIREYNRRTNLGEHITLFVHLTC